MQYSIQLTEEEVTIVLSGLGKLPAESSFNLLTRLLPEIAQQKNGTPAPAQPALED